MRYKNLTRFNDKEFKRLVGVPRPYVELKCSPAKIMQGHNIYGTDWIEEGALEMLGYLAQSNPALYGILDIGMTEVKLLDATYSFRFRDDREAEKVLALMRNVSTQHIRKSTKDATFKNTLYFGSERCKRYARKVYVKFNEFKEQLEEQIKLANVIPFIKMFEMKFEDQLPPNFVEPVSMFSYQLRTA